jgi:hypothetical protein
VNRLVYDFALWLDAQPWSTALHESYYMYNWVESTHVLALMLSVGILFLIDLRILGLALPGVPATRVAERLFWPMVLGFALMVITGLLLYYAIPVRTSQSLWFRFKLLLLAAAALNAFLFHRHLARAGAGDGGHAPAALRLGAGVSLGLWLLVVVCGRLIAYDWFDCAREPAPWVATLAGCVPGQTQF